MITRIIQQRLMQASGSRELYPEKKSCWFFSLICFSRTRDFADDFAKSLSQFDELF
jgi:UDP-N-acetylmuramate--alanine ligase